MIKKGAVESVFGSKGLCLYLISGIAMLCWPERSITPVHLQCRDVSFQVVSPAYVIFVGEDKHESECIK